MPNSTKIPGSGMKPLKDYNREELVSLIQFYQEREKFFSRILDVPDRGQFRADWTAQILDLIRQRDLLHHEAEKHEGSSLAARQRHSENEALRGLLNRALPLLKEHGPLVRDIAKALKGELAPGETLNVVRDALEVATIYIQTWHNQFPDAVDESDKIDLNWFLDLLGRPRRYEGVPEKQGAGVAFMDGRE